jgi:hypothetical protein
MRYTGARTSGKTNLYSVFCSSYSFTLKMEAICSSETPLEFLQTTLRHIPGGRTLHFSFHLPSSGMTPLLTRDWHLGHSFNHVFSLHNDRNRRTIKRPSGDCLSPVILVIATRQHLEIFPLERGNGNLRTDKFTVSLSAVALIDSEPRVEREGCRLGDLGSVPNKAKRLSSSP